VVLLECRTWLPRSCDARRRREDAAYFRHQAAAVTDDQRLRDKLSLLGNRIRALGASLGAHCYIEEPGIHCRGDRQHLYIVLARGICRALSVMRSYVDA
jgi:hypothetical protein